MKKVSITYNDEMGLTVNINLVNRSVTILNYRDKKEFVFQNSKEETVRKIGEALIRIADIVKKELPNSRRPETSIEAW